MKNGTFIFGTAVAALLSCASVNAQVLGGNVNGALGGTLSGGLHDMGAVTNGRIGGSLGTELDTGTLRRTTRDVAERTTDRAHRTTAAVRDRTESKVGELRDTSASAAASTTATATQSVKVPQIGSATDIAGSASSGASLDGGQLSGVAETAASKNVAVAGQQAESKADNAPALPQVNGAALSTSGSAAADASASQKGVSAQTSASAEGSGSIDIAKK